MSELIGTSETTSTKPTFKQKAKREMIDYAITAGYLAFFFCALIAYSNLLLHRYDADLMNFSLAIINAMVIGKVILIGEMVHVGRSVERRPLYQSVLLKSILFSLLVFAVHFLEEFVKRLIRHEPAGTALHEIQLDRMIARAIVVFCSLLPLFAFRELRRVLGEGALYTLFTHPLPHPTSQP
jgi:hypothetical protein